ncbi:MAG: MFS transporter, partial [Acetobacteraceae bacterium]|nr:MFS transporter [Acetobacteraceae bacterium]
MSEASALRRARAKTRTVAATDAATRVRASRAGLDWFTFFCANLQTGFGPFIAVYLTTEKWSQTDIGIILMGGGLVGLLAQMPGGALVDSARRKALVAGVAVALIGVAGLLVAMSSLFPVILFAWVLHSAASCVLSPAIATVSLALVGHKGISERLGRNASFASIGSALAAGGMGAVGYYLSNQAVFFVTAALAVPALLALSQIGSTGPAAPHRSPRQAEPPPRTTWRADLAALAGSRAMVVLAATIALFFLANAAMLPLVGSMLTLRSARSPTIFIAACIIVPQIMVAVLSPLVGWLAQRWGRRPLLLIACMALPLRGLALALTTDPLLIVATQALDGISAAVIGVMVPLIAADVTRNTG